MKNQRTPLWWFKTTRTIYRAGTDTNQLTQWVLHCSGVGKKVGVEIGGWVWGSVVEVGVDVDDVVMIVMAGGGSEGGGKWRVRESGSGDRVDPEVGSVFGLRRKSPPEKFSGGGEWWPAVGEVAGEEGWRGRE
ncbi:hypothetical protein Tco_0623147 [Tanacetum coccineum]